MQKTTRRKFTDSDMEEELVRALLRTTQKLHCAIQMKDPDGYSPAEQERGEEALWHWLESGPDQIDSELRAEVLHFLLQCDAARV